MLLALPLWHTGLEAALVSPTPTPVWMLLHLSGASPTLVPELYTVLWTGLDKGRAQAESEITCVFVVARSLTQPELTGLAAKPP